MTVGKRDRGVRRLREPESLRTDPELSVPLPNVWRQWRAGEAVRVHCTPGLGTAEWKRGGLRKAAVAEARGKNRGRAGRCAEETVLSRMRPMVLSWA